jgi:Ser/Thr protein kinase RdoA (MazF antagonist)
METLLREWAIGEIAAIEPIDSSTGTLSNVLAADGRRFVLKRKVDRAQVDREQAILSSLSRVGAPVAPPLPTRTGQPSGQRADALYCLYPLLPGSARAEGTHYDTGAALRARRYGWALSGLHTALRDCPQHEVGREQDPAAHIENHVLPRVKRARLANTFLTNARAVERQARQVVHELREVGPLPRQIIHRDPHPGNLLFSGDMLTGVVDFDQMTVGPRIFDPCYCGTSILASGVPEPAKMNAWPALFTALLDGYREGQWLTPEENRAVVPMLCAIELIFIGWAIGQDDRGTALRNEHVLTWLLGRRAEIERQSMQT